MTAPESPPASAAEPSGDPAPGLVAGAVATAWRAADWPEADAAWRRFSGFLGVDGSAELDARSQRVTRQVRDNGITYNVYADANGPQRPWSLDLFPLLLDAQEWARIAPGVAQRARLLEALMGDLYGGQQVLARNLLPPALVYGHPGYLRAMRGVAPVGGRHLRIMAFDLARSPTGEWWVVAQRTQAPSGLGYLLENRLIVSRQFAPAFAEMGVARLAATYRALLDGLEAAAQTCCAPGEAARVVLLTPGPYNETYFEHAYLARYLGLPLVEGSDLTVRAGRVYLKTLRGLLRVHGILRRLDDEFLDPLELRPDSALGVPGLLQSVRSAQVAVTNAPGSGLLESPALQGFLPGLCEALLGETLQSPSLDTWWCGERAALEAVLPLLGQGVIKSTYPGPAAVLGRGLSQRERDEWAGRLMRSGEEHTVQAHVPLSVMPTWRQGTGRAPGAVDSRAFLLRAFAVADAQGQWQVLPGGLTRIAAAGSEVASMQRGGSSADTWVLDQTPTDTPSLLRFAQPSDDPRALTRATTSRAAENLFWLGRYTERTENTARLAHGTLERLNGEEDASGALLSWMGAMAVRSGLVHEAVPSPAAHARRIFERALVAALPQTAGHSSVGFNLSALRHAASQVRERISQEHWNLVLRAQARFETDAASLASPGAPAADEAMRVLNDLLAASAAMTGAQTDRMLRDDGWRVLSIGRHLERLAFLSGALAQALACESLSTSDGFDAVVALFDSSISFHARFQQRRDMAALVDMLVCDRDNPRSLAWVAQTLRSRLAKLEDTPMGKAAELAATLPDPATWHPPTLVHAQALAPLLQACEQGAYALSDALAARHFSHSDEARHALL